MVVFLPGFHRGALAAERIIVATLVVTWLIVIRVHVSEALIPERIHTTRRHPRIIHTWSLHHHLVLTHNLGHACSELLLVSLLLSSWLLVHV